MPYHWVRRHEAETGPAVAEIEANGEEIVAVFVQSDHFDLFTRKLGTITDDGTTVTFKPVEQVATAVTVTRA